MKQSTKTAYHTEIDQASSFKSSKRFQSLKIKKWFVRNNLMVSNLVAGVCENIENSDPFGESKEEK